MDRKVGYIYIVHNEAARRRDGGRGREKGGGSDREMNKEERDALKARVLSQTCYSDVSLQPFSIIVSS